MFTKPMRKSGFPTQYREIVEELKLSAVPGATGPDGHQDISVRHSGVEILTLTWYGDPIDCVERADDVFRSLVRDATVLDFREYDPWWRKHKSKYPEAISPIAAWDAASRRVRALRKAIGDRHLKRLRKVFAGPPR